MKKLFTLFFLISVTLSAQLNIETLTGKALANSYGYHMLEKVCDLAGGRLMGTPQNELGFEILKKHLSDNGLSSYYEEFTSPIWYRGEDKVVMTTPCKKELRASALAYSSPAKIERGEVVYVLSGYEVDYEGIDVSGKIVVISQTRPKGREEMLRGEAIKIAFNKGAVAALFINEATGGKVLCGVGNFKGNPLQIPAFSLTFEEGSKLKRLLENGEKVVMDITSNSFVKTGVSKNLVCTFEGTKREKIVIGAHFDSWDLGDGAADNGHGSAVIFEAAVLLNQLGIKPERTIEFVWFNGEETGLWGSKKYVEQHKNDSIFAMFNLDMPGKVNGYNVMGFDHLMPAIKEITAKSGTYDLSTLMSTAWTNSDHMFFYV
ncbi:MAG: M20/M25/M40 family metallo-hydrolase [Ignavibacteriales bacterium]|nr:M20/M25/M40 family metallo-hydrolase [Ignavibacteriales bacterium]